MSTASTMNVHMVEGQQPGLLLSQRVTEREILVISVRDAFLGIDRERRLYRFSYYYMHFSIQS